MSSFQSTVEAQLDASVRSGPNHDLFTPLEADVRALELALQGASRSVASAVATLETSLREVRLGSRELLYTALTRARERLVLFNQGPDVTPLYELGHPGRSETARRNSRLLQVGARVAGVPYAEHLMHRARDGTLVRSKSELVIVNLLVERQLAYEYERRLDGRVEGGWRLPDFTFIDPGGDPIVWEHIAFPRNRRGGSRAIRASSTSGVTRSASRTTPARWA